MPPVTPDSEDEPTFVASKFTGVLKVGSTLINGNYEIEAFIGRGGMGEVYRARHIEEGDLYAIKVMRPEIATDDNILRRFIGEARELKRVNDDAIVRYRDFLRDESGARCLVMEYVSGESLAAILRTRHLDVAEIVALLRRVGGGLVAVHELGIVHRDISPDNIILPNGDIGRAKLIDFGIAKSADPSFHTLVGNEFVGKYSFVSPEQLDPERFGNLLDRRSDIYSLGLVLAATALGFGKQLDMGRSLGNAVRARESTPDLGELPPALRPLITGMLQPRPEDRPNSIRAVLEAAENLASKQHPLPRAPRYRWPLRRPVVYAGAAVLLCTVTIGTWIGARPIPASPQELQQTIGKIVGFYRCSDLTYSADSDRVITVSGHVQSVEDVAALQAALGHVRGATKLRFAVRPRGWPLCQAFEILKPLLAHNGAGPHFTLAKTNSEPQIGRRIELDVQAPGFDSYLYVDSIHANGDVVHLFPNAADWFNLRPARNSFVLGRAPMQHCWIFAGSRGENLITAVASRRPLFGDPAGETETAREFLPRLSQALARSSPGDVAAGVLFYELRPSELPSDRSGCPAG